jgi:hypothetical protein
LYPEAEIVSEPRSWLIAVFETDEVARRAARKVIRTGTDPAAIRVGDPLDALTSIRGEMREEVNGVVAAPMSGAGAVITLPLAASAGTTLAVPDTRAARHALLQSGSVRIDVVGSHGRPIDTLRNPRPRLATRAGARHARRACRTR